MRQMDFDYVVIAATLKLLPQLPEPIFIDQIFANIAQIGSINTA